MCHVDVKWGQEQLLIASDFVISGVMRNKQVSSHPVQVRCTAPTLFYLLIRISRPSPGLQSNVSEESSPLPDSLASFYRCFSAAYGNLGTVYKITKQLCGKCTNQTTHVRDKNGNICISEKEQAARWVQHFQEVLNLPEPEQPANITTTEDILEINTNPPDSAEVKAAIQTLKSGKACGIDAIHSEMLKADIPTSTRVLKYLFQNIWNSDTIPEDWSKGLIVKVPKKGNLKNCDNWRGNHPSVYSKQGVLQSPSQPDGDSH